MEDDRPLLEVDGVTLRYKTPQHLVTATYRVSFRVWPGDRFVLLGPSGCGKSTLLKAVGGYMAPTEGDIDAEKSKVSVRPVSAEQTVLSMDSVAASVITNDFLGRANIDPKSALASDDPTQDSAKVFNNLFAATEANADNETLKKVASFYYDPKVLKAEDEESKGTAVPTEIDQQELKDLLKRYQEDLKEQTQ